MSGFGDAPIRAEGQWVKFDNAQPDPTPEEIELIKNQRPTTWIEFSLPSEWEDEFWEMIEGLLKKKRDDEKNGK